MSKREIYDQVFMECLMVESSSLNENLAYQSVEEWDSIGHMTLIAALEDAFDIMIETDDIIDFESYPKGTEILAKYDVVV